MDYRGLYQRVWEKLPIEKPPITGGASKTMKLFLDIQQSILPKFQKRNINPGWTEDSVKYHKYKEGNNG